MLLNRVINLSKIELCQFLYKNVGLCISMLVFLVLLMNIRLFISNNIVVHMYLMYQYKIYICV